MQNRMCVLLKPIVAKHDLLFEYLVAQCEDRDRSRDT